VKYPFETREHGPAGTYVLGQVLVFINVDHRKWYVAVKVIGWKHQYRAEGGRWGMPQETKNTEAIAAASALIDALRPELTGGEQGE